MPAGSPGPGPGPGGPGALTVCVPCVQVDPRRQDVPEPLLLPLPQPVVRLRRVDLRHLEQQVSYSS